MLYFGVEGGGEGSARGTAKVVGVFGDRVGRGATTQDELIF